MFSAGVIDPAVIKKIVDSNTNFMCDPVGDGKHVDAVCKEEEERLVNQAIAVASIDKSNREVSLFRWLLRGRQQSVLESCAAKFKLPMRTALTDKRVGACIVQTTKDGLDPTDKGKAAYPIFILKKGEVTDTRANRADWFRIVEEHLSWRATDSAGADESLIITDSTLFSNAVPSSVLDKMNEIETDAAHKPYIRLYRLGTKLAPEAAGDLEKFLREKPVADIDGLPALDAAKTTIDVVGLLSGISAPGQWTVQAPDALFDGFTLSDATVGQAMALRQLYEQAIVGFFTKKTVKEHLETLKDADKKTFIETALLDLANKVNAVAKKEIAKYASVDFAAAKDDARLQALEKMVVILVGDLSDTHLPDFVSVPELRATRLPIEYSDGLGTLNDTERDDYAFHWTRINKLVLDATQKNAFVDEVRASVSASAVIEFAKVLFADSGVNTAVAKGANITFDEEAKRITLTYLDAARVLSFEIKFGQAIPMKVTSLTNAARKNGVGHEITDEQVADAIAVQFDTFLEKQRKAAGDDYSDEKILADLDALLHMTLKSADVKDGKVAVTLEVEEKKEVEAPSASFGPSKLLKKDGKKTEKLETHGSLRLALGGVFAEENVTKPEGEDSDNDNKIYSFEAGLNYGKHNYTDEKETSAFGVTLATSAVSSPGTTLPQGDGNTALASPGKVAGKLSYTIDEIAGFWNVLLSDPEAKAAEGAGLWDFTLKTTFGATSNDVTGNGMLGVKGTLASKYGRKDESFDGSTVTAKLGFGTNLTMGHDNAANLADNDMGGYSFFGSLGGAIAFVPEFILALTGEYGLGNGTYESPVGEKTADYYKTDLWQIKGGMSGKLLRSDAKGKKKDKEADEKKEDAPPTSVGYALTGKYTSATEGDVTGYGAELMFSFNGYLGDFTPSAGVAYDLTGSQAIPRTPSGGTGGGLGGGAAGTEGRTGKVSEEQGFDAWTVKAKGVYDFGGGWAADIAANLSWQSRLLKMAESRDDSTQTVGSLIFGIGYEH